MTHGPMAVQAASAFELNSFDERPYRRELAIAMHGGLAETKCIFIGCNNRLLSSIVFCVDHQYPEYAPGERPRDNHALQWTNRASQSL